MGRLLTETESATPASAPSTEDVAMFVRKLAVYNAAILQLDDGSVEQVILFIAMMRDILRESPRFVATPRTKHIWLGSMTEPMRALCDEIRAFRSTRTPSPSDDDNVLFRVYTRTVDEFLSAFNHITAPQHR